jgi:hypothetical protein
VEFILQLYKNGVLASQTGPFTSAVNNFKYFPGIYLESNQSSSDYYEHYVKSFGQLTFTSRFEARADYQNQPTTFTELKFYDASGLSQTTPFCPLVTPTKTPTPTPTRTPTPTPTFQKPVITNVTEINIWFDSSGSMGTTLGPLQQMQNTLLKNCIGPIYGYNPSVPGSDALYNERVKVISNSNERFISWLSTPRNFSRTTDTTVNQVLNLTFADESNPYGYGQSNPPFNNAVIASQYATDITTLRNNITGSTIIKGIAFRVSTNSNQFSGFRALTQATFVDTGVYTPRANLRDLPQFTYQLDVTAGTTPSYYLSKVVEGLNTLGFPITCP